MTVEPKAADETSLRPVRRLPSVDGWRALSILMVLAGHSVAMDGFSRGWGSWAREYFPLLFDGNLGVRFFFVISGFLITYLLIQEHRRNGKLSLKAFYIRRALRILPVYLAYLAVVAFLQFSTQLHQAPISWIGDLTFTVNFLPRVTISGHLWSLSVEEQFYLLWPITFVFLNRRKSYACWILAAPIVVAVLCRSVSSAGWVPWIVHPLFHHHSSLVNFDALDVGCVAAFALANHKSKLLEFTAGKNLLLASVIGVLLIVIPTLDLPFLSIIRSIFGDLFQSVGFGILLLASILHPGKFKLLNWGVATQLGLVSYSVYIWQQIFFAGPTAYGIESKWWMSFPGWLPVALIVGFASFYGFERPLLRLRTRFRV